MTKFEKLKALAEKYGTWADDASSDNLIGKIKKVAANRGVNVDAEISEIMEADNA